MTWILQQLLPTKSRGGKEIIMLGCKFVTCSQFWCHTAPLVLFRNTIHRFPGINLHFPGFNGFLIPLFMSAVAPLFRPAVAPLFRSAVAPLYLSPSSGFKETFTCLRHTWFSEMLKIHKCVQAIINWVCTTVVFFVVLNLNKSTITLSTRMN